MRNPTARVERCTAQLGNGSFCDAASMIDMPFPICRRHAGQVYERLGEHLGEEHAARLRTMTDIARNLMTPSPERLAREKRRKEALRAQSVVYYVRIGEHVKIGTTTNLKARLSTLRVDPDAVLATEPGGYELERQRHREFATERIGRRENFTPSRRLVHHIKTVRAEHGEPMLTTFV